MIAYLEKYDTTVEVPDNATPDQISDINDNFHSYVDQKPAPAQPVAQHAQTTPPVESQPTVPNFYQSTIAPSLANLSKPLKAIAAPIEQPEAQAFAGKTAEQMTFGVASPFLEKQLAETYKEHPAFSVAGDVVGGIGSLMEAGGAARALGIGKVAAGLGKTAVEAGLASGERFIPKAIMSAATFGTRTFIAETVKAFQDGKVDLSRFGEDVLKDTAFGGILGALQGVGGGLKAAVGSVSAAGGLGFLSAKMSGADNREASLHAGIWAAFEAVSWAGRNSELRMEAIKNLKDSMGEYAYAREPSLGTQGARRVAGQFVDQAMAKAGYESAEDIAKSGPENLLEGIEKVNQMVRTAKVPATSAGTGQVLPKLPAPIQPEAEAGKGPETAPQAPQTPLEKAVDFVKGIMGIKEPETEVGKALEVPKGATYEQRMEALQKQGHDISKLPESAFPEDLKDIYHFEHGKGLKGGMEKSLGEIAERFQALGIKPNEGAAIFNAYGLAKKGPLGQPAGLTDLVNTPIEDQYQAAYQALATQRGLVPDAKPNAQIMDHAQKAVDLINGYFNPQSQMVFDFAKQHPEASDHDVAQMAHDRGLLEEANPDLLKMEIQKAKQENPIIHAQMPVSATMPKPSIPIPESIPKAEVEGTIEPKGLIRTYYEEIRNFLMPSMADPEGARILSASFSHAARQNDIAEFAMRSAKKYWAKQSHEDVIEFYDNLENGREQPEKWKALGQMLREGADKDRKDVQALGEGKLEEFNENFAAHYWEKEGKIAKISQGRAPFEGSKGFLKQRTFQTLKEGIEAGKIPLSWNPVDLFQMKHAEMQRFVASHKALQDAKRTGRTKYVRLGSKVPENALGEKFVKINDPVGTVYKSPMVAVKEAFDEQMMKGLNDVAESLGVDLERSPRAKGEGKRYGDAWGLSMSEASKPGEPGKIWTRFAGPESALAHELGHQLDHIYGLQAKFLSDPKIDRELSDLANQRIPEVGKAKAEASKEYQGEGLAMRYKAFQSYVQKPEEKMAAMLEAYIHAPDLLKEVAPNTYSKLTDFLKSDEKLKPLTEIKPGMVMGVGQSEVYAGGPVLVGNVYAEPNFARLFNNHLSKGLERSAIFRGYRFLSNLVNQIQLFGGFHANFMAGESMATELDIAMRNLFQGNLQGVAKGTAKGVIPGAASVDLVRRGMQISKAWRMEPADPLSQRIADIMEMSGGRIRMDDAYSTKAVEQMKDFFQKGRNFRGLLSVPFAALDEATSPILKKLVPLTKVGAYARMLEMELENNPNMTNQEAAQRGQKIWNTIEYRMGQMTYDNIFWNKTFKDALHFGIRSVAWNFGTAALAAFGLLGLKDLAKGKRMSEGYYALSYWIASAMVTATGNAVYQYLMTGKGPQEAMDYLYPKNGGIRSDGKPSRSIPLQSYWPTVYNFAHNPVQTMIDKMNPVLSMIAMDYHNKDFFGEKIREPVDPDAKGLLKRLEQEAAFYARTIQPFGLRNMMHNLDEKNAGIENTLGSWIGDTHAPYWIDQTKAEATAHDILSEKRGIGGRTEEQIERSKLVNDLRKQYRENDPNALGNIEKAFMGGAISTRTRNDILTNSKLTPIQRMVKGMSLEEAEQVYSKADDEEKAQLELIMEKKKYRHEQEFVAP